MKERERGVEGEGTRVRKRKGEVESATWKRKNGEEWNVRKLK